MRPLFFNPAKGLSLAAVCLAGMPAMADDFVVPSAVASAVVFPVGATLTRAAEFDLPAGRHQIILADMPVIDPASLRVSAPGVTLGAVRYRDDFVPPRSDDDRAALAAAKDGVEAAELRLEEARDAVAAIRVEAEAARAGIGFLEQIGQSDGLASAGPEALRDLARMIAEEGLEARRAALAAETRMRGAERGVKDALEDLNDARKALAALDTEAEDRAYLTIEVTAQAAVKGALTLEYATYDAGWIPTYDMHLTTGDDAALRIERGAYVAQHTGEDWGDIALTLSTIRPTERTEPGRVWPWLRRITDPAPMRPTVKLSSERAAGAVRMEDAAVPMAEPVVVEEAVALSNGLSVTYSYPEPVSVANRADAVKIALGSLDITPEIFARAVPLSDDTAFLMAGFTNDTGEMILNADQVQFYLDGTFIGQRPISLIAEGDDTELSFGPIEGLRLERIVKDRQEGDRGVISRSNQQVEDVVLRLRNLTNRDWLVRLSDRVPYSEQEDLEITWSADPMPFAVDVDGARGVLEWRMTMGGGDSADVTLKTQIKWPEDKVLR
jgi:uncharacterized protein (TIGR02231 family)